MTLIMPHLVSRVAKRKNAEMKVFPTVITPQQKAARRLRIGVISPASDILIERDFWRMGFAADVDIFTTRIPLEMPLTPQTLGRLADGIAAATALLLPETEIDAIVFGCTSGSAVIGPENVAKRVHSVNSTLKVTNPATAAVAALAHLKRSQLAFIAPYTSDVAEKTADIFRAAGVDIVDALCLGLLTDEDIAIPGPDHYMQALSKMDLSKADAVFLSCTTSRALDAIEIIEAQTGLPVITSNQASFWHAARLAGRAVQMNGFGRLFH
jgi:maleate isomerase